MDSDGKSYVKTLVYVFVALGLFIIAILGAYFGGVGIYFGQAVVEGDVFTGGYKYDCNNANETASECTNLSTTETTAFTQYQTFRTDINATIPRYINATTIVFSLLGLVFLFLALKSSGLWKRKGQSSRDEY